MFHLMKSRSLSTLQTWDPYSKESISHVRLRSEKKVCRTHACHHFEFFSYYQIEQICLQMLYYLEKTM